MTSPVPIISFHYLTTQFYFPHRTLTKSFIASIFEEHHRKINAINYIFCSDEYLLNLNRNHLNHNYYTDIITFDLSYDARVMADVFISIERAKENAAAFHKTVFSEVLRLLIHGALHLCDYKDKTKIENKNMRRLEEKYLHQYLVSRETRSKNFN